MRISSSGWRSWAAFLMVIGATASCDQRPGVGSVSPPLHSDSRRDPSSSTVTTGIMGAAAAPHTACTDVNDCPRVCCATASCPSGTCVFSVDSSNPSCQCYAGQTQSCQTPRGHSGTQGCNTSAACTASVWGLCTTNLCDAGQQDCASNSQYQICTVNREWGDAVPCPAGKECLNGACICPSGQPDCNGSCCSADQLCRGGACVPRCAGDAQWNGSTCDCSAHACPGSCPASASYDSTRGCVCPAGCPGGVCSGSTCQCAPSDCGAYPNCHACTCADYGECGDPGDCHACTCDDSGQCGHYPNCHDCSCFDFHECGSYPDCEPCPPRGCGCECCAGRICELCENIGRRSDGVTLAEKLQSDRLRAKRAAVKPPGADEPAPQSPARDEMMSQPQCAPGPKR
jgi:hypothetical protein